MVVYISCSKVATQLSLEQVGFVCVSRACQQLHQNAHMVLLSAIFAMSVGVKLEPWFDGVNACRS